MQITRAIEDVFARVDVAGVLHARRVDQESMQVGVQADQPVVLASVFKITVALAYARAVAEGSLDPRERATVTERYRVGGIGTAGFHDDAELSLRDLASLMMTQSDNAATDIVLNRVGLPAVQDVIRDLQLSQTRIDGGCEYLFRTMFDDLEVDRADGLDALEQGWREKGSQALRAMDPLRSAHRSTPRDITRELSMIWTDSGSAPRACKIVRDIMADQVWTHRLTSGFDDDVTVAGKTGTLATGTSTVVRNEAGVVGFPDGRHYAVAVFLRARTDRIRNPLADAAIGTAASLAIEHLRTKETTTIVDMSGDKEGNA